MSILSKDEELIVVLKAYLQSGALHREQLRVKLDNNEISLEEFLQITKKEEKELHDN